ncbi:glycosyltransferase [Mesonia maritima]|uniref:Glycosyltransferase involved in cell wall biosynthesis n=1 Tax=Mesonia maritima TaxID=1793873 RepID=A0ABU1K7C3_9FLAO|nr:glycosyltransferase [Mesonia maritima]MDR6301206.1 glycosyltransferase involved in cell wall biosynthesis [Mesonia maritima]
MKILLVGEYSRLHNSLKEGLQKLGHEVTIIATGDYFKNFPADIKLSRKYDTGFLKKIKVLFFILFRIDITQQAITNQFFKHKNNLIGYDAVQLINERPFNIMGKNAYLIIDFLKKNNKTVHLLACGTDYISVKFALDKKYRYSILTPYFNGKINKSAYRNILNYTSEKSFQHHQEVFKKIDSVTASDIDYVLPYQNHSKFLGLIPNPINTEKLKFIPFTKLEKIIIFHGINRNNYYKKGNDIFEKALQKIKEKYSNKVEILSVSNLPYSEYIEKYNQAHVLLDQIYAYDQGYNALEAMAKGKVVFTGAEKEFLKYYNLQENEVCINALPDINYLIEKLSWLIENPSEIKKIGENARKFIEEHHDYKKIASKYIDIWMTN